MHDGVEQGRVQPEPGGVGVGLLGQGDLGEDVVAAPPGRLQALEDRAVLVAPVVQGRRRRRPGRSRSAPAGGHCCEVGAGLGGRAGQDALGVQGPRARRRSPRREWIVTARRPRRPPGPPPHWTWTAAVRRQDQRRLEGEFLQLSAAGLVAGPDGQLHEGGAGQQDGAQHGVVGQPRVGVQRQPAGEQQPAVGQVDGGAEQRVLDRAEPGGGDVAGPRPGLQPVALALERVGGQVDGRRRARRGGRSSRRRPRGRAGRRGPPGRRGPRRGPCAGPGRRRSRRRRRRRRRGSARPGR